MKPSDLSINNSINTKQPNHPNYIPLTVECYPEINQAVLKAKDSRFYDCWLVLREKYKYQGNCSKKEAAILLSQQLNITKWSAYKLIREGDGLFWNNACKTKDKVSTVWLVSVEKVCIHYGIEKVYQSVIIDLRRRWSVRGRRAGIYEGAIVKHPKGRAIPVSREKLTERTGVCEQTQRHYEQRSKIEKKFNYVHCCSLKGLTEEQEVSRILDFTTELGGEFQVRTILGKKVLIKQCPNTYFSIEFEYGNKSALRRLNQSLGTSGDTMASGTLHEKVTKSEILFHKVHPYAESKKQTLFRNATYWTGKVTLNYPF